MRHKIKLFALLAVFVSTLNCTAQSKTKNLSEDLKACQILSQSDAGKILGQTARLTQDTNEIKGNVRQSKCTYTAVTEDETSKRKIDLFFMLEETPSEKQAKQIYESIRKSNEHKAGIENLSGIGDESLSHAEKPNFYLVMARKGKFMIRLKINKAVGTTSFEELKAFAKKVAEQI